MARTHRDCTVTRTVARVAVFVPSSDTTLEYELPMMLRGRATVHFTRMRLPDVTPDGLDVMEAHAHESAALLADISPDVVLFGCTSGSFFRGATHELTMARTLAAAIGAPFVATAWAVSVALRERGSTVRIRTPYSAELTAAEAAYMESAGLRVSSAIGLGITRDDDIAALAPQRLLDHADGDDVADVLLMSCTNVPTIDLLPDLQRRAGMPVVTSNSAAAEAVIAVLAGRLVPLASPRHASDKPV